MEGFDGFQDLSLLFVCDAASEAIKIFWIYILLIERLIIEWVHRSFQYSLLLELHQTLLLLIREAQHSQPAAAGILCYHKIYTSQEKIEALLLLVRTTPCLPKDE